MEDTGKNNSGAAQKDGVIRRDVFMAFNQEDLTGAYQMKLREVYLVGGRFTIPADQREVVYLRLKNPIVTVQEAAPCPSCAHGRAPAAPREEAVFIPRLFFGASGSYWGSGSGSGSGSPGFGLCGYGLELI